MNFFPILAHQIWKGLKLVFSKNCLRVENLKAIENIFALAERYNLFMKNLTFSPSPPPLGQEGAGGIFNVI